MSIYILQVPHQMPPEAWIADSKESALALLSTDYIDFDDLDDAVGHDMAYGMWAESKEDLIEQVHRRAIGHQFFKAAQAVEGM